MIEADGWSEAARDLFREAHGMWALRITNLGPDRMAALQVLHKVTGAPPSALLTYVREGTPVAEGSPVEIDHVALLLDAAGVEVERERIDRPR